MDPTYPLVPIVNMLACVFVLLPLSASALQWNIGVRMYAVWLSLLCFFTSVNTIVWSNTMADVAPVLCDITSHIDIASNFATPACSLVITRRLFLITQHRNVIKGKREKRNETVIDLLLCLGLPVVAMGLYYVVQSNRYAITEDYGCSDVLASTVLSLIFIGSCSILFPIISGLFYCPRIVWIFYHQRREMNEFLRTDSHIDRGTYFRIMLLGCLDIVLILPVNIIAIVGDALQAPLSFWPGWAATHTGFSEIPMESSEEWRSAFWDSFFVRYNEWINVILAFFFFILFGLTGEARSKYRATFWAIAGLFGFKPKVEAEVTVLAFKTGEATNSDNYTSQTSARMQEGSMNHDDAIDIELGHDGEKCCSEMSLPKTTVDITDIHQSEVNA